MGKPKRNPDRSIAPVAVANILGIGVSMLAGWMREAGVDTEGSLTESDARTWRANPDKAPDWLRPKIISAYLVREERQRSRGERDQRRAEQHRQEVYAACDLIYELLRTGDRKLRQGHWLDRHPVHAEALMEITWRAMKDSGLASQGEPDFTHLSFEEREALRIEGYDVPEPTGRYLRVAGGSGG